MTDVIDNKVSGGNVWDPYASQKDSSLSSFTQSDTIRYKRYTYFLTFCAIVILFSLIFLVSTAASYIASKQSLKAEGDSLSFNQFNLTFNNSWLPVILFTVFIILFVSSLFLRNDGFDAGFICFMTSVVTVILITLTSLIVMAPSRDNMTFKMNNLIGDKIGITYQEIPNPNFTGSEKDYYSSNLYIGEDDRYYYLAKKQKGQKVTLTFEEVQGNFNFVRGYSLSIKDE
jgi:hypothetical protein